MDLAVLSPRPLFGIAQPCMALLAAVVTGVALLAVGPLPDPGASSARGKLDLTLQHHTSQPADQVLHVIVRAASGTVPEAAEAVAAHGGRVRDEFRAVGAVTAILRTSDLMALADDPRASRAMSSSS